MSDASKPRACSITGSDQGPSIEGAVVRWLGQSVKPPAYVETLLWTRWNRPSAWVRLGAHTPPESGQPVRARRRVVFRAPPSGRQVTRSREWCSRTRGCHSNVDVAR
ncbi:hypothetical protein GCM10010251_62210 [Streptomyces aurantiogriseus]|uniref:Uncharacterized protein n=1 Tax=Streptomyces aurantiogriseus TaxID=66870 RepID=A0A918KWI3_9ACTN|nr:hypothetical protein GCM10010251_62210 [Streptomyces aurantiogriseus]